MQPVEVVPDKDEEEGHSEVTDFKLLLIQVGAVRVLRPWQARVYAGTEAEVQDFKLFLIQVSREARGFGDFGVRVLLRLGVPKAVGSGCCSGLRF